jgi:acyl-CoA thioesterase I
MIKYHLSNDKMKIKIIKYFTLLFLLIIYSCSNDSPSSHTASNYILNPIVSNPPKQLNYLAIGDSYTIGQSVCETCRFPEQLRKKLGDFNPKNTYNLKIIAQTGWTTTNLISAIKAEFLSPNYDLVTLLIGVNNQYQSKPFQIYQYEFPELVNKAIELGKGDKSNVIVISIPDYAYTPYGQNYSNQSKVSAEIDSYNTFAQQYCLEKNIEFISITDITRLGLKNPALVAQDGLHPSEIAYSLFVDRMIAKASIAIHN